MEFRYRAGDAVHEVVLERRGEALVARIGDREYEIEAVRRDSGAVSFLLNGRPLCIDFARGSSGIEVAHLGHGYHLEDPEAENDLGGHGGAAHDGDGAIRTPMPGKIVDVRVSEGDAVEVGQALLVVESMKMQNDIVAPIAGKVIRLPYEVGANVEFGDVLVEIAAEEED